MQRQTRFRIISLLTAAVWTAAIAQLLLNKKMPSRSHVTVTIASEPKRVRIQVKSEKNLSKYYVDTPINLTLAPGRRRIRVSRPGYRGHEMIVEGTAGDHINIGSIVLERDPSANFGLVEVKSLGKGIAYEFNDRLFTSEQTSGPFELLHDIEHELIASISDQRESGTWSCRFKLKASDQNTPQNIYIRRIKGRSGKPDSLRITPCDQVAASEMMRPGKLDPNDSSRNETNIKE